MPGPPVTGHRKRCRRINEPGDAHFLTFSCFRRQAFLSGDHGCDWLADAVRSALKKNQYHLWAYVFMPNHVHLLVWPTQPLYQISQFLASSKRPVTSKALDFVRRFHPGFLPAMLDVQPNGRQTYRFWQRGGGFDRNLWTPRLIWKTIDYIHNNPVRRGLCEQAHEWLWSSAGHYYDRRVGPLALNLESVPERIEFARRRDIMTYDP